jgi:hypothetical protein
LKPLSQIAADTPTRRMPPADDDAIPYAAAGPGFAAEVAEVATFERGLLER